MVMLNKMAIFILVYCILYLLREGIAFFRALLGFSKDYKWDTFRRVSVGLSLSYILTIIITGFPE